MRIFVLEDEIDRLPRSAILDSLKDHEVTVARSFDEAKEKYHGPYDILLLDHDMEGFHELRDGYTNTGFSFVKWLTTTLVGEGAIAANLPQVVLHSQNSIGRRNMLLWLEDFGFHAIEYPYCRAYSEWLKTI